jgi:lipid-A-disaccharide synthase
MKRIFISTGEVSGDLQGSLLVKALHEQARLQGVEIEIVALGGQKMAAAGAKILGDTTGIGSMGIVEHLAFIAPTQKIQAKAKAYLEVHPPDAIILIDYMNPNIFIGNFARKAFPEVPVFYYIAPQEWVWSASPRNTEAVIKVTDRLFAVFPGEAEFYSSRGANVQFVGHPLVDRMLGCPTREEARAALGIPADEIAIALIPASRWQELKYLMPPIFEAAQQLQTQLPKVHFWIPLAREEYRPAIEAAIGHYQLSATLVADKPDAVLAAADLAIAKSGTVSLELALLKVPHIVIYKFSKITAWIAQKIIRVNVLYVSPANLAQMKPLVPELIQDDASPERIVAESLAILQDPERRQRLAADFQEMRDAFGPPGACDRVAQEVLLTLKGNSLVSTSK